MARKRQTRKIAGKKFSLIGEGFEARAWQINGIKNEKEKGNVVRAIKKRKYRGYKALMEIEKEILKKRFLIHKIAHIIFPENVLEITQIDLKKLRNRSKYVQPDKLLEEIREITRIIEEKETEFNEKLRKKEEKSKLFDELSELYKKREKLQRQRKKLIESSQVQNALEKLEEFGFKVDTDASENFNLRNPEKPVFYELIDLNVSQFIRKLKTIELDEKTKKKIEKYLRIYLKLQGL